MSLARKVPPGSGLTETAVLESDTDVPLRVPEPTGTVDASCRAGVSSPRVVSLHMVSVLTHGSPRGPAVTTSGVRSLSCVDPSASDGSAKSFRYLAHKKTGHLSLV